MSTILSKISNFVRPFISDNNSMKQFGGDAPFPHCDSRILHAPKSCDTCDMYPHYQELRKSWGINFTGEDHEYTESQRENIELVAQGRTPNWFWSKNFNDFKMYVDVSKAHSRMLPCPAAHNRPPDSLDSWVGNVPRRTITDPEEGPCSQDSSLTSKV
jgi:hypothetical protein